MARRVSARLVIGAALSLVAGLAIAWIDTRPGWDDTGITAGALFLAGAGGSLVGAPFWIAALLVGGPLVIAEISRTPTVLFTILIPLAGATVGALVRRFLR